MFASRCINGVRVYSVVFLIVVVLIIVAYGFFIRKTGHPDVLERNVTDNPSIQNLDGWAATHLLFWGFMGFWFPRHYFQALVASLAWEGFEDTLGRVKFTVGGKRLQLVGATDSETFESAADDEAFWYGRYTTDTAYNLIGYIIGSTLAGRFWPDDKCGCERCAPGHRKRAAACKSRGPCSLVP
jgi:hypothetical protein